MVRTGRFSPEAGGGPEAPLEPLRRWAISNQSSPRPDRHPESGRSLGAKVGAKRRVDSPPQPSETPSVQTALPDAGWTGRQANVRSQTSLCEVRPHSCPGRFSLRNDQHPGDTIRHGRWLRPAITPGGKTASLVDDSDHEGPQAGPADWKANRPVVRPERTPPASRRRSLRGARPAVAAGHRCNSRHAHSPHGPSRRLRNDVALESDRRLVHAVGLGRGRGLEARQVGPR